MLRRFRGFQRFQKLRKFRKLSIKKELFMPVFPMNLSIASRDIRAASSLQFFLYITKEKEGKNCIISNSFS